MKRDLQHLSFVLAATACSGLCGASLGSTSAMAAGVKAGVLIENTATASYTAGTTSGTIQSNKVTVRVDELLDASVAGLTSSLSANSSGEAVLAYSLVNTGNGPESFILSANPAVAGNDFDAQITSIVIDSNSNGSYDPGVDQILAAGAATPALDPDATLKIFAIVSVPADAADGETSQVTLWAEAATGTGAPGTTFAGAGDGGGDAVVGLAGAKAKAEDSLRVRTANVTLSKSASVLNGFGSNQPIPGAIISYRIDAAVQGSGSVEQLVVSDVIPAGTSYEAGSLMLDNVTLSDAADSDAGSASASGIAVQLGTTAGGVTRSITFKVKIN